jgi:DNA-binding PucR family transcriptional regulator
MPTMDRLSDLRAALDSLRGDPEVSSSLEPLLRPLRNYDTARGTDLMLTLRRFLDEGGNIAATADRLFLHRNSVVYRLSRIEEMTGLDLRDRDVRETLRMAAAVAPEVVAGRVCAEKEHDHES